MYIFNYLLIIAKEKGIDIIPIDKSDVPFEIPENWEWVRLGDICGILGDGLHGTPKYDEKGEYYFINGNNLKNGIIETDTNTKRVAFSEYEKHKKNLNQNTIFVSINGTLGNLAFYNSEKIILGKSACYFNLYLNELKSYIYLFLTTPSFMSYIKDNATGSTIKNVSLQTMRNTHIPLPPLTEQTRIVEAIENFNKQIEIIEENQTQLQTTAKYTKSKILDLAIRGKLVSQCSTDESATTLLEKIRLEKETKIAKGELKRDKNSSFIFKDNTGKYIEQFSDRSIKYITNEIPFEIPQNWAWCRLGEVCDYGKCQTINTSDLKDDDWILDLEDIEKDTGKILDYKTFKDRNSSSTKHIFYKKQLLYSKLRPYLNKVLIAPKNGFCTSEILPLSFYGDLSIEFLHKLLRSPYFLGTVNSLTYGVKMPRLGTDQAKNILIPLPPLAEQIRIVEAIENIMTKLEVLE